MILTAGEDVGGSVGVMLLSRQHRSRHPPGKIAVTVPEQTGAQPKIGRTSQNFTHPGTDGPLSGQSTSHSSGKNGPGLPSGQLVAILTMGAAVGRSVSGALVGTFLGGTTGDFVGIDEGIFLGESTGCMVKSTGDVVGASVRVEGTPIGRFVSGTLVGNFLGGTTGAVVGLDVGTSVGEITGFIVTSIGDVVGVSVGLEMFGRFVGGGATGLSIIAGAIEGTLTGRNEGFLVRVGGCGEAVDGGDVLGTATSLVIVIVNVPTSSKSLFPVTKKKYCTVAYAWNVMTDVCVALPDTLKPSQLGIGLQDSPLNTTIW